MSLDKVLVDQECVHFERCAGCSVPFKEVSSEMPVFKEVGDFFKSKEFSGFKLNIGDLFGWRTRSKLAVRGPLKDVRIGLFEGRSHQLLEVPECKVHHPLINQTVETLKDWVNEFSLTAYDEKTGQGLIRYVQLDVSNIKDQSKKQPKTQAKTQGNNQGKIQLVIVINVLEQEIPSFFQEALLALWSRHEAFFHSVWLNFNVRRDNVIFGEKWELTHGEPWLTSKFLNQDCYFHPASFMQGNPVMFEKLLAQLAKFIPENAKIAEFYAGSGVIGLSTALPSAKEIHFNEISPLAKRCFDKTLETIPQELTKKVSFLSGDAGAHSVLLENTEIDLVIVDPPRKGVDKALLNKIVEASKVKRLIYVSCGWESFKKEADFLLASGFTLTHAEAFLFFPGTEQLETLAVFDR